MEFLKSTLSAAADKTLDVFYSGVNLHQVEISKYINYITFADWKRIGDRHIEREKRRSLDTFLGPAPFDKFRTRALENKCAQSAFYVSLEFDDQLFHLVRFPR